MPRPTNKQELLEAGLKNFERLATLVNSFNEEQKIRAFPASSASTHLIESSTINSPSYLYVK